MILVNGCSFTTGEESPVAWPSLIRETLLTGQTSYKAYAASINLSSLETPEDGSYTEIQLTPVNHFEKFNNRWCGIYWFRICTSDIC